MSNLFPGYEEDIFISYSHVDNPYSPDGWVDKMHERLKIRLRQVLGVEPKIWRDPKLDGTELIQETIDSKLKKIVFLISILSPRYVKSESCLKEVKAFYRCATEAGGICSDTKLRILKVLKTPIEDDEYPDEYPPEMRKVKGYMFYEKDEASQMVTEFLPEYGQESFSKFVKKLDEMAWELKVLIKHQQKITREQAMAQVAGQNVATTVTPPLVTVTTPATVAAEPTGVTIYLAETSELNAEREDVRHALQMLGHHVLPDEPLPLEAGAFAAAVNDYLSQSQMSIHLLGAQYNPAPKLDNLSIERAQYELVAKRQTDPQFCSLLWSPKDLQVQAESPQAEFLRHVEYDSSLRPNDEFLQTKLEDLKTIIEGKLKIIEGKPKTSPAPVPAPVSVAEQKLIRLYIICDEQDIEAARKLKKLLNQSNDKRIEGVLPLQEGEDAEIAEEHRNNLLECDGAIVFYGQTRERWLRQQLMDLRKINGDGRQSLLKRNDKAVYINIAAGDPKEEEKKSYETNEAVVTTNYGDISLKPLESFLAQFLK